jgi:hypothetical protein
MLYPEVRRNKTSYGLPIASDWGAALNASFYEVQKGGLPFF